MVVAQLFEVTVAADGTELHSKRVSKLSLRYHRHKKQLRQLRQSAMMAELPSDTWVCPKCSYKNQDWQRCMGPGSGMGAGCDTVRPGGPFDTSEFALSTQPPSTSSIRRSTISVGDNHPAAAARRAKKKNPPTRESPGRDAKKKACDNITLLSGRKQNPTVNRLPSRPPPRLRDFTPPPPIARPLVSDAHENSIATGATSDAPDNWLVDFSAVETVAAAATGGGREVDFSAVEPVAAAAAGGGREVHSVNSSDSSSGDEESKESVPLFGAGLVDGSPTFSLDNEDQVADSPTDNEVSKYSFFQRLSHYMDGQKISSFNRAAVELCILSEAGAFVRNMDPMKKEIKEKAFLNKYISIVDEIEDDQFVDEGLVRDQMRRIYKGAKKDHTAQSLWRKYEQELTLLPRRFRVLVIWRSFRVVQRS
jgi:hypothetical protein